MIVVLKGVKSLPVFLYCLNLHQVINDSAGVCVQFCYGEDGLDVMKTSFIRCPRASDKFPPFSFLVGNRSVIVSQDDLSMVKEKTDVEAAPRLSKKVFGKLSLLL